MTMSLEAVRVINKSGRACYLFDFSYLSPDGKRFSAGIDEMVLNDGNQIELHGIESFNWSMMPDLEPKQGVIQKLDDSKIVTIIFEMRYLEDKDMCNLIDYGITSKVTTDEESGF